MKKVVVLLMTLCLVFSFITAVNAGGTKEYLENISYIAPEGYEKTVQDENHAFFMKEDSSICINVLKGMNSKNFNIMEVPLKIFEIYDAEYILDGFDIENSGAQVVFSNKNISQYCTAKGIPVLKFHQDYVIKLEGYYDYSGFFICILFLDGEDIYMVELDQNSSLNDYFSFNNLIDSIELGQEKYAALPDGNIKIIVNGEVVTPDSAPVIKNGRTLCPIRAVAEALGYNVNWDEGTKSVNIKNEKREITVIIGEEQIKGNYLYEGMVGSYRKDILWRADVPAEIINGRTYLPLRAVSEALDCHDVFWNAEKRTVVINSRPSTFSLE